MAHRLAGRLFAAPVTRAWTWGALALVVACVEGPVDPGRFGELRFRPLYRPLDTPSSLGFAVDSARVRITRSGTGQPLVDTVVAYTSDTTSLAWLIDLTTEEETMQVEVDVWDDGSRLYSGAGPVLVRDGAIGDPASRVDVAYVGPPIAKIVAVTPGGVTLDALGATSSLTAEARDRYGEQVEATFAWTSDDAAVASVDPASGVVTARGNGTATVRAATGAVHGTVSIVVEQRPATITVTPDAITLDALGETESLSAAVLDPNGHPVSDAEVAWSSSNPDVATVHSATGVITAIGAGSATITATSGSIESVVVVTVNPTATVASISVSPSGVTLTSLGATQQYAAVARDAAGATVPGVTFTWSSSATGVATISQSSGLATATGHGAATITAMAGSIQGSTTLSVNLTQAVRTIAVSPPSASLTVLGGTKQFAATARDENGAVIAGVPVSWSSTAPGVATIHAATGLATATGHGATTIRASIGATHGDATLSVDLAAAVASIDVTPASATLIAVGATRQFAAVARDANGVQLPGVTLAWSSSATNVATIDATSGVATAVAQGSTTITATSGGVHGTATLAVNLSVTIATIDVTPATATLTSVGATQQFTAIARDANGATIPGVQVTWSSATPQVATIDPVSGLATAAGHGSTTITAAAGSVTGSASLGVQLTTTIASVIVTPQGVTLTTLGATRQYAAEARDANGAVIPNVTFTWTSSATSVATIGSSSGLAKAVRNGTATITARAGNVSGMATLTVAQAVARVVVSPDTIVTYKIYALKEFTARAYDANDNRVFGVAFTWSSSNTEVATVNSSGLAKTKGFGTAEIRATTGGVSGSAALIVKEQSGCAPGITVAHYC